MEIAVEGTGSSGAAPAAVLRGGESNGATAQTAAEMEVAELTALAKRGDCAALEELICRFEAAVYRLCFRILGDVELAQDARQETFMRVLQSLDRFELNHRFSTWLFSIATHVALDMARHESARPAAIEPSVAQSGDPLSDCIRQEDLSLLEEALVLLAPRTRALLALRFQENLSPVQISKILEVSPNQVRVDLWRARMALRQALHVCSKPGEVPAPR